MDENKGPQAPSDSPTTTQAPARAPNAQAPPADNRQAYYQQQPAYYLYAPASYYPSWYYSPTAYSYTKPKPSRSNKPAIVGTLLVVAGFLSMILGGTVGAFMLEAGPLTNWMGNNQSTDTFGNIEGTIIYLNSTPAAGVNITVVDSNLMGVTNATGHYKILGVPTGWHDLKIEKSEYKTILESVYVSGNYMNMQMGSDNANSVTADFQLQPGGGDYRLGKEHTASENNTTNGNAGDFLTVMGTTCLIVSVVFGSIAVVGGYFAFKRTHLPMVVVGAVFGIMSLGMGLSTILSIIALIVLLVSTDEFDKPKDKDGEEHYGHHGGHHHHHKTHPPGRKDYPKVNMQAPTTRGPEGTQTPYGPNPVDPNALASQAPRTY